MWDRRTGFIYSAWISKRNLARSLVKDFKIKQGAMG